MRKFFIKLSAKYVWILVECYQKLFNLMKSVSYVLQSNDIAMSYAMREPIVKRFSDSVI